MMDRNYKPFLFVAAALLVVAIICGTTVLANDTEQPVSPQTHAESLLTGLHISDAKSHGVSLHWLGEELLSYSSEEAGYTYSFNPNTGNLRFVEKMEISSSKRGKAVSPDKAANSTLKQLKLWLKDVLIGELTLTSEHDSNMDYTFNFVEFYEGQYTGTAAYVTCAYDGTIDLCVIHTGTVFTKSSKGDIVPVDTRPLIGEEKALAIGEAAAAEAMAESSFTQTLLPEKTTCTLKATGDHRYYYVEVYSHVEVLCEGYYQVVINPYDGTVEELWRNN